MLLLPFDNVRRTFRATQPTIGLLIINNPFGLRVPPDLAPQANGDVGQVAGSDRAVLDL